MDAVDGEEGRGEFPDEEKTDNSTVAEKEPEEEVEEKDPPLEKEEEEEKKEERAEEAAEKKEETVSTEEGPKNGDEEKKEVIVIEGGGAGGPAALGDEEYFANLSETELSWYRSYGPDPASYEYKSVQCTGCSKQIMNNQYYQVLRHPLLGVPICRSCKNYYQNGEWTKDEEGYDVYCRWCGNGGDLLLCDFCTHSFCKRCLQRNLGRRLVHEITEAEKWKCLLCDPTPIYSLRSLYYAFVQYSNDRKLKRKTLRRKESPLSSPPSSATPENFIDENIGEAFETLAIYQKCLEDEKRRWIKCKKKLEPQTAGAIARNLRKIYAITKQNMDLLDSALVQSYSEGFPGCSLKKLNVSGGVNALVNQKRRKRASAASSHPEEFVVNGSPVTAEYHGTYVDEDFDPSSLLQVEFQETSPPPKPVKVSLNLFSKKKKTTTPKSSKPADANDGDDDSDIEVLTLDSDDESTASSSKRPSTRSPSPSPSPVKKRRPGPKSKTMA